MHTIIIIITIVIKDHSHSIVYPSSPLPVHFTCSYYVFIIQHITYLSTILCVSKNQFRTPKTNPTKNTFLARSSPPKKTLFLLLQRLSPVSIHRENTNIKNSCDPSVKTELIRECMSSSIMYTFTLTRRTKKIANDREYPDIPDRKMI